MRRILAISALLAATIACKPTVPRAGTSVEGVIAVDPADPPLVTLVFEAWWSDDARRGARIESGGIGVNVGWSENLPDDVVVRGTDLATGEFSEGMGSWSWSFPGGCTEEGCDQAVELTFDVPAETEPFEADLMAWGEAFLSDQDDADDLEVRLDVERIE